jgi:hypothetical protein
MRAIDWIMGLEWSMGNGQCPTCHGNQPDRWAPHPCVPTKAHEGHKRECGLAEALRAFGIEPKYRDEGLSE